MLLYSYFRSSAAYRVRIALNLKGLAYEVQPLHLRRNGGEHRTDSYAAINPEQLVPALRDEDALLTQSLAIIEYLEEVQPSPALLPAGVRERSWVRALAQHIACEVHPLNNLRVLHYLQGTLAVDEAQKRAWVHHWVHDAFTGIEARLVRDGYSGTCCFGDEPTLADCCLVPQVANARRFDVDLTPYPRLAEIDRHLRRLPAFVDAAPENQIDADQGVTP